MLLVTYCMIDSFSVGLQASVSLKRLQSFLKNEELDSDSVQQVSTGGEVLLGSKLALEVQGVPRC